MKRIFYICFSLVIFFFIENTSLFANENDGNLYIPLSIEYDVIQFISIQNTDVDEYGQLYLMYEENLEYAGEVIFNDSFINIELYINGDPILNIEETEENKSYVFSFAFYEEPTDITIQAIGEKKQLEDIPAKETVIDEIKTSNPINNYYYTYSSDNSTEIDELREKVDKLEKLVDQLLKEEEKVQPIERNEGILEKEIIIYSKDETFRFTIVVLACAYVVGVIIKTILSNKTK